MWLSDFLFLNLSEFVFPSPMMKLHFFSILNRYYCHIKVSICKMINKLYNLNIFCLNYFRENATWELSQGYHRPFTGPRALHVLSHYLQQPFEIVSFSHFTSRKSKFRGNMTKFTQLLNDEKLQSIWLRKYTLSHYPLLSKTLTSLSSS